jgi:hypothetical protein
MAGQHKPRYHMKTTYDKFYSMPTNFIIPYGYTRTTRVRS